MANKLNYNKTNLNMVLPHLISLTAIRFVKNDKIPWHYSWQQA